MGISYGDWQKLNDKLDSILIYVSRIESVTAVINAKMENIMAGMDTVVAELNGLADKVTALETVEASAVALLQGLKAALDAALASADPTAALAAVAAISDRLGSDTATLADAVTANTPAAP